MPSGLRMRTPPQRGHTDKSRPVRALNCVCQSNNSADLAPSAGGGVSSERVGRGQAETTGSGAWEGVGVDGAAGGCAAAPAREAAPDSTVRATSSRVVALPEAINP